VFRELARDASNPFGEFLRELMDDSNPTFSDAQRHDLRELLGWSLGRLPGHGFSLLHAPHMGMSAQPSLAVQSDTGG